MGASTLVSHGAWDEAMSSSDVTTFFPVKECSRMSLKESSILVSLGLSLQMVIVNVYYVMGFRPFRPNYFTCTAHLYLYCTLLVSHTYASYIRH